MADSKQEETFKVVDRRLFTQDGELRRDVVEQQEREEESAKNSAKRAGEAPSQPSSMAKAQAPVATAADAAAPSANAAAEPSRGFQMLVDFLTRNAAAMLGGMADPSTGRAFIDLEGAREIIDMLDVLRDKTKSNLAPADDELLVEVLGSLKLTFLEVSKAAGEAMNKKAKGKP